MASPGNLVTTDELLERARALTPVVRERAAECENLRRLPEETEQAFRDAGFYRVLQPQRHGGFEMDYGTQTELACEIPDIAARARCRRDISYAAKLCVQSVERIFPLLGGRGLASGDPVQRAWRDVHAAAQNIGLVWDVHAGAYGAVAVGLDCPDPRL